jgi:hypothetical protein
VQSLVLSLRVLRRAARGDPRAARTRSRCADGERRPGDAVTPRSRSARRRGDGDVGATPVFADVDETTSISRRRAPPPSPARAAWGQPRAIIVDLFGLSVDHDAIAALAAAEIYSSSTMPRRHAARPIGAPLG